MMKSANRVIVSILVVAGLAAAFWILLLSPKREEVDKLTAEAESLSLAVATARSKLAAGEEARREFPADYRQLVVLGQAAPANDDTSSLLVELSRLSRQADVKFTSLQLNGASGESAPAPAPAPAEPAPESSSGAPGAIPAAASVPATEVAASLLPLGAAIGPAGLGVMPYELSFSGSFFQIADFIEGIDGLVKTKDEGVGVDGRLVTVNGFSLSADSEVGFPMLEANFSVTTYVTPPGQGTTAGASPSAPATTGEAPVSTPVESSGSTTVSTAK